MSGQRKSPLARRAENSVSLLGFYVKRAGSSLEDSGDLPCFGFGAIQCSNLHGFSIGVFNVNVIRVHHSFLCASGLIRSLVYSINQMFGFVNRQYAESVKLA